MTFAFRLRFHLTNGNVLNSDQLRVVFNIGDQVFKLISANGESLNKTNELILSCGGFETKEDALVQGSKLKNCLSVSGAILKRGIDVGKEKTLTFAGEPIKEIFEKQGFQLIDDLHGLSIYRDDIQTSVITGYAPSITVSFTLEELISSIKQAYTSSPKFTEKEKIAFDLYNASFFESSTTARFLTLVSVVEALSETSNMDDEVIEFVEQLIIQSENSKLNPKNKVNTVNRLRDLKKQSISASMRQLINEHLSDKEAKSFKVIYNIRSGLLHDGVLRCSENEFSEKLINLNNMVAQLLVKVIEAKAPEMTPILS